MRKQLLFGWCHHDVSVVNSFPKEDWRADKLKLSLENKKPSLPKGRARADLLQELSSDMTMILEASTAASGGARAANSFASSASDTIKKTCTWVVSLAVFAYWIVTGGGKVLSRLSKNMCAVVLAVFVFSYRYYGRK